MQDGQITSEEALTHPQRNVLTRALGVEPLVTVDAWLLSPNTGDRLLLCSDGLTNELDDERIGELLGEGDTPESTARRLAAEADAAGGRDNTTAVVVDVLDSEVEPAPLTERFRKITTPAVDLSEEDDIGPHTDTVMAVIATPQEAAATSSELQEEPPPEPLTGDEEIAALASSSDPEDLAAAQRAASDATSRAARWRTAAFVAAIVGVVALAFGAIFYTAGRGWYVAEEQDGFVALYRGTPVLWLHPQLVEVTEIPVEDLKQNEQGQVRDGASFESEQNARDRIDRFVTTTTSTTTTTTTAAPTTTAPVPSVPPGASAPPAGGQ